MKILAVHNFHRKGSASGDDQVFKNEVALLKSHGNTVVEYTISNSEFDNVGMLKKILLTFGMLWNFKHYREIQKIIKKESPDVVHIHTFFPLLSPSVLYAAKHCKVAVIATLHDTRFICPCATSLRGQKLCNSCGDGHYFRMYKYKCFKNSGIQSMIVAIVFKYHRICRSFYNQIDKYICLNDNQIQLLENIGFDPKKIVKKYNFVPDLNRNLDLIELNDLPKRFVVFYGRIGEEKGVRILMKIWDHLPDIPLVVMGGGPLENEFELWAREKENVYYLGYIEHEKCFSIVKKGEFVVFPSIWYEGCSMVEVETESLGKAIIATDLGFSAEAIQDGVNGYKIPLGNKKAFISKIRKLWNSPALCSQMGINARLDYEGKYMSEHNYQQLIKIYESV